MAIRAPDGANKEKAKNMQTFYCQFIWKIEKFFKNNIQQVLSWNALPENESWILSCLGSVNLVCSIVLSHCHLHELGDVEGEGEGGDWDDVDQQASGVCHGQANCPVLVGPAHSNVPGTFSFWSNLQSINPLGQNLSCYV